jgi:hypothetical protein
MRKKERNKDLEKLASYLDGNLPEGAAIDEQTERTLALLRREAASVAPSPSFVENLSTRLAAKAAALSRRPSLFGWLTLKLVPRLLGAVAAVAAVLLLLTWIPYLFPEGRELEPALPDVGLSERRGLSNEGLFLPQVPAALPRYRLLLEPLPETAEDALSWASRFGIPDPEIFHDARDPLLVSTIGSNGEQLNFHRIAPPGVIYYSAVSRPLYTTGREPLTVEQATAVALAFLRERNLLPTTYHVEEEQRAGVAGLQTGVRRIQILADLGGYPLRGSMIGAIASLEIGPEGKVYSGTFRALEAVPAETVAIRPPQEVLAAFSSGQIAPFHAETTPLDADWQTPQYFFPPPLQHQIGETVTLSGWPTLLVSADGQRVRASLHQPGAVYELTGQRLNQSIDDAPAHNVTIEGTITADLGDNRWQVEVTVWSEAATGAFLACFTGVMERRGSETWLISDGTAWTEPGAGFRIPNAPEALAPGERAYLCAAQPVEPEQDLAWLSMVSPPPSDTRPAGMSVSEVTVVEVTRVVSEAGEQPEDVPPPGIISMRSQYGQSPSLALRPGRVETPYMAGETVTVTGVVKALIFAGAEERLEVSLHVPPGDDGIWYNYRLLGDEELLSALAHQHHNLHATVSGVIEMIATDDAGERAAIFVTGYDRTWPEERVEAFLGSVSLENVAGEEVAVFTDQESGQRYIYGDRHFGFHDWAPVLQEEKVWVAGAVHPDDSFAGLPVLRLLQTTWGSDVDRATSAAVLPLPAGPDVIPDYPMRSAGTDGYVVERIEFAYFFEPQFDHSGAEPWERAALLSEQWAEPVWVLYGRDAAGTSRFTAYIRAAWADR